LDAGKIRQYVHVVGGFQNYNFSLSHAGFGIIFLFMDSYLKAGKKLLKMVSGRFPSFKCFIETCKNFILNFLHKKAARNSKTIGAHPYTRLIMRMAYNVDSA
jgi:hypothetical protein